MKGLLSLWIVFRFAMNLSAVQTAAIVIVFTRICNCTAELGVVARDDYSHLSLEFRAGELRGKIGEIAAYDALMKFSEFYAHSGLTVA